MNVVSQKEMLFLKIETKKWGIVCGNVIVKVY